MIKMIASDLDGTLIREGAMMKEGSSRPEGTSPIEEGFFEVLDELLDRGYLFYVATGRQYANARRLFDSYADRIGFACENGALALEREEKQYVLEIPREKAMEIAEDILQFPETDICLSGVKACYIRPRTAWFEDQLTQVLQNKTERFEKLEEIDDQIVKIAMYIYDFPKNAERIREFFVKKYGTFADFVCGGNDWLDVIMKNTGKGRALQAILEKKGLKPEELMVFGDNQNDLSMLELTPNSYCMAHAKPDVKAHAAHTCESVVQTLRQFLEAESRKGK